MANASWFETLSTKVTRWVGTSTALGMAFSIIVLWIATGPIFDFSDTWQLVINTGTTIITFLMVFLIQRSQNKDAMAIQLKLNELVAAIEGASNRLISVEDLQETEIQRLHEYYKRLSHLAMKDEDLRCSHSVDEAQVLHEIKHHERQTKRTHRHSHAPSKTHEAPPPPEPDDSGDRNPPA